MPTPEDNSHSFERALSRSARASEREEKKETRDSKPFIRCDHS